MNENVKVRKRRRALGLALIMLLLAGLFCGSDCAPGCTVTVTCVHAWTGVYYTFTQKGCRGSCGFPMEKVLGSEVVSCPAEGAGE